MRLQVGTLLGEQENNKEGRKTTVRGIIGLLVCNIYSYNIRCTVMYCVQKWSEGETPAQVEDKNC